MGLVTIVEGEEDDMTRVFGARWGLSTEEEDFTSLTGIWGFLRLGETKNIKEVL